MDEDPKGLWEELRWGGGAQGQAFLHISNQNLCVFPQCITPLIISKYTAEKNINS